MKGKYRILFYLIAGFSYYFLTFGFLWADSILAINNIFISVGLGFAVTDFFMTRILFRSRVIYDVGAGIGIHV